MSEQKNLLEQVRDDAISIARAGDGRQLSSAADSRSFGNGSLGASFITRPNENGETVGPFIVDETPVDSPTNFLG